ncbi:MAG: putative metal-dependent hydrolase [Bacteroidota bacterium]|nr:MAG: putative metal-dependent hydrolase [Bacteroidota bacterium]
MNLEQLKYPIGQCPYQDEYTADLIQQYITSIRYFPEHLEGVVQHLNEIQLQTPYRPGGWTVNQVIHHCADSHMNMLIRLKLALTEDCPVIKPYLEAMWAEMPDYALPFNVALTILHAVHRKIDAILQGIAPEQLKSTYVHPQYHKTFRISDVICLYAWHGKHHLAHITELIKRNPWENVK